MGQVLALAIAIAIVIVIAACTGDDDSALAEGRSPLVEFLGLAGSADLASNTEAGLALAVLLETERQEAIAQCMAEQGFEYVPYVPAADTIPLTRDEAGSEMAWIEHYGFGVSTLWFWQDALPDGLAGYTIAELEADDPNLAIVAELSEAEDLAYGLALYGDGFLTEAVDESPQEPVASDEPDDDPDLGCHQTAGPADIYEELTLDFADEMAEMEAAIENDPRVIDAYADVAVCVQQAGFDFASPAAAVEELDAAMEAFAAEVEVGADGQGPLLTAAQAAELGEIQRAEIGLAKATEACGGSSDDLRDLLTEVRHDHEARFIEANRDELERFREALRVAD